MQKYNHFFIPQNKKQNFFTTKYQHTVYLVVEI